MQEGAPPPSTDRRSFSIASIAMASGLAASYGTLGYIGFEFLKPKRDSKRSWMLVKPVAEFDVDTTLRFRTPDGATVNVTRRGNQGTVEDFKALSSICPHLGCQVHWEPQNDRYFCPCHNGTFDGEGKGTGGPPGDAGQSLGEYGLRIEKGLLFIEVSLDTLVSAQFSPGDPPPQLEQLADAHCPRGAGHDPCLAPRDAGGRPA